MKVLVVDDDPAVRRKAARYLRQAGYTVSTARDGEEALARARSDPPNLVLLDLILPRLRGSEVYRILSAESDVPIMLLATEEEAHRAGGPAMDAEEYLAKPFKPRDMLARVQAAIRRSGRSRRRPALLTAGRLTVDPVLHEARLQGTPLSLRPKAFDLLVTLMERPGQVLSREEILQKAWGYAVPGKTRTVDVHVNHLRQRLKGTGVDIETVRGIGYMLVSEEALDLTTEAQRHGARGEDESRMDADEADGCR